MITFRADTHEYAVDGVPVPGVTTILKELKLLTFSGSRHGTLNPKIERALKFGTYVHRACALEDESNLNYKTLDPNIKPWLDSWINFKEAMNFKPTEIEKVLFSKKYWFAGTVDRVGLLGKDKIILDIKTGVADDITAIQTAGYAIAYNEALKYSDKAKYRLGVFLCKGGEYRIQIYKEKQDESVFLSALTVYNYRRKHGTIRNNQD